MSFMHEAKRDIEGVTVTRPTDAEYEAARSASQ